MTPAEEIIVAKAKLEAEVGRLVADFTQHTGCFVLRIDAHPVDTTVYATSKSTNPLDRGSYAPAAVELMAPK